MDFQIFRGPYRHSPPEQRYPWSQVYCDSEVKTFHPLPKKSVDPAFPLSSWHLLLFLFEGSTRVMGRMIYGVKLLPVLKFKVEFPCHFLEALSQTPRLNGAVPVPRVNSSLLYSVGFVVSVVLWCMSSLFPDLKSVRRVVNLCSPAWNNISVSPLPAPASNKPAFFPDFGCDDGVCALSVARINERRENVSGDKDKRFAREFLHPFCSQLVCQPLRALMENGKCPAVGEGRVTHRCAQGQLLRWSPKTLGVSCAL